MKAKLIIGAILLIIAGAGKGLSDRVNFHPKTLPSWMQNDYWLMHGDQEKGIRASWRNKWKNGDKKEGEAFRGSSTIFVALTDAWHQMQWVYKWGMLSGMMIFSFGIQALWKNTIRRRIHPDINQVRLKQYRATFYILSLLVAALMVSIGFNLVYR